MSTREIQELVCRAYGVRLIEMLSARRSRGIIEPRFVAMWLTRETTPLSLPAIGQRFGGRDHKTVMHALAQIEKRIEADAEFARRLIALRRAADSGNSGDFRRAALRVVA